MRRSKVRSSKKEAEEPRVNKEAISELFTEWADEPDLMTMEGIGLMAEALDMDPSSDVRLLALCWRLGAKKPSQVDREEFERGMEKLGCDDLEKLKALVVTLDPAELDHRTFRDFFKFVFLFSREGTHRTLEKDIVDALLPIAIGDRSQHTTNFLTFLDKATPPNTRITLDQWCSFLEFSVKVKPDFSDYEQDGAWPLLLDEFVDYHQKQLKEEDDDTKA